MFNLLTSFQTRICWAPELSHVSPCALGPFLTASVLPCDNLIRSLDSSVISKKVRSHQAFHEIKKNSLWWLHWRLSHFNQEKVPKTQLFKCVADSLCSLLPASFPRFARPSSKLFPVRITSLGERNDEKQKSRWTLSTAVVVEKSNLTEQESRPITRHSIRLPELSLNL